MTPYARRCLWLRYLNASTAAILVSGIQVGCSGDGDNSPNAIDTSGALAPALTACSTDAECVALSSNGCPVCGGNPATWLFVRADAQEALRPDGSTLSCDPCASTPPAVYCAADGHCADRTTREEFVPVALRCTFAYRESNEPGPDESPDDPKFVHEEKLLSAAAGESAEATHAKIRLSVTQSGRQTEEGGSFNISAIVDDKPLASWLYQFDPADPPRDQFWGGHGFTGLVYLTHPTEGGDYQFYCSAVREQR